MGSRLRCLPLIVWLTSCVASAAGPEDCAPIAAADARLACYDGYFRVTAPATTSTATPPSPAPSLGEEQVMRRTDAPAKPKPSQPDEITASVVDIDRRLHGELRFRLDNEQVWTQIEVDRIHVRKGDRVTVRRNRLGGYTLTTSGGSSTRVTRLE